MGKGEKRKTRLNKGESGEFIGFGAFAAPAPAGSSSNASSSSLSPIYTGSDSSMNLLFPRIGQKRDETTKAKALRELRDYFADDSQPKKSQVEALSHFLYLYHFKLNYDNTPRIRASCLECCHEAFKRIPKAWKTLCEEQKPEILGMVVCARADTATDVRVAANQLVETLLSTNDNKNSLSEGVWDYVKRILLYGKSKAMYEDLFQKKDSSSGMSERQKEEMEERYERIVRTALGGIQLFIQQFPNETIKDDDAKFLWKTLTSTKGSLRRGTYSLLSTVCQKIPTLIDDDKISKLLLQSLSSEKEPSNLPTLLETLLSFVAQVPFDQRSVIMAQYVKPLTKLFKKGCFGATQWAPTVLPIVAILPPDEQPSILTSVWEGRTNMVGVADCLQVVAAVAETATFLLLKPHHDLSEVIAKCWLQSLQTYLTTTDVKGPALRPQMELSKTLARDLFQLDQGSQTKPTSAVYHLKDWFWGAELLSTLLQPNVDNQLLSTFLADLAANREASLNSKGTPRSHLLPILKEKFQKLLEQCQGASGLVPSLGMYELWIAILNHSPIDQILDASNIEKFVMNDLLRWMVIHTSSLSEQANEQLAKQDFILFHRCRLLLNPSLWDSILREVVAAKCDLHYLMTGLVVLVKAGGSLDAIRSFILEDLCIQVAKEATEPHVISGDHESDATELRQEYHRKCADFLQTSAGLGEIEGSFIGKTVIKAWIDCACPTDALTDLEPNPVLETLINLSRSGGLDTEDSQRSILQCWRQGGYLWEKTLTPWLADKKELKITLVSVASRELQVALNRISSLSEDEHDLVHMWSERSFRLLILCKDDLSALPTPSLTLFGLDDLDLWRKNETKGPDSILSQCLMKLISHIDDLQDRWMLFLDSETDALELVVRILMSLSGASTDILKADYSRRRIDVCALLLKELGGEALEFRLVEEWSKTCISILASYLLSKSGPESTTCRGIAVLSQILELGFPRIRPSLAAHPDDRLQLDKVNEGDSLWYIVNQEEPSVLEKCTIFKIHRDLPSEVYFTIKVERDGVVQERQTVGERLRNAASIGSDRSNDSDNDSVVVDEKVTDEEISRREDLLKHILNDLVMPTWDSWKCSEYELLNVGISQVGLFGKRGVGSAHYCIFQKLVSIQGNLRDQFDSPSQNKDAIVSMLWQLSLALGFGCNTPPTQWGLSLIGFDPKYSMLPINAYYESLAEQDTDDDIDCAIAAWLTVSASSLEDIDLREQTYSLLFQLAARLLCGDQKNKGFNASHLLALRALQAAQKESHRSGPGESVLQDSEAEALVGLVKTFASQWEGYSAVDTNWGDSLKAKPDWYSLPIFNSVIEASFTSRTSLMALASRQCIDDLVKALYTSSKRWYALQILDAYAEEGVPLHDEPEKAMNETTSKRLKSWCKELIEGEAEELEEDVGIVAQWIPQQLMNDIEHWHEMDDDLCEDTLCGILSSWLAFLRIVDVAASKDTMNRPALTSYITRCKAVDTILNILIIHGNIGGERKVKLDKVVAISEILQNTPSVELSKLAVHVSFRTVEVFPTLAKNWWEMVCPNYCTQAVRDFVETYVSPEILQRELNRIKQASFFGEMNVKGSSVSREVTATYIQDDFTLTVVIKLPLSFPFRRAEVDCSRTLGVPESRWKRWSLQITQMLNNQGGTLKDALLLWKENVDKEFEGVEPCPVCYSVLHVKTHKLPEMECKTCRNRFHFDCLTQWFRSSGKSACVLCQQPWSGTRVQ